MTISFELPPNLEQQARTNEADPNREAKAAKSSTSTARSGLRTTISARHWA